MLIILLALFSDIFRFILFIGLMFALLLLPVAQAYGEFGNFLKDLQDTFGSKKSLSEAEIIQGLNRTLRIGMVKAIDG